MKRAYQYRAYCNKETAANAEKWLYLFRNLYNCALEAKIIFWKQWKVDLSVRSHKSTYENTDPSCSERNKELLSKGINGQITELKEAFPEYKEVNALALIEATDRLEKAYKAFFRRVKAGETPGFPRFRGRDRYDSFTLGINGGRPCGWKLEGNRLSISKIGTFKIKLHRKLHGTIKTVNVRRDARNHWYIAFSCDEVPTKTLPVKNNDVGIDMGIKVFCFDSDGNSVENNRTLRKHEEKLATLQRAWDKKKRNPRSKRKERARLQISKAHEKIVQIRKDFLHKISTRYIRKYGTIYHENLNIKGMIRRPKSKQADDGHFLPTGAARKAGLNKSMADVSWGNFFTYLAYKAEEAGRTVMGVDPKNTSQKCSGCGVMVPKTLAVREHACPECGLVIDRDHNASINVLQAGRACAGITPCRAPRMSEGRGSSAPRSICPNNPGDCSEEIIESDSDRERAPSSQKTDSKKVKKSGSKKAREPNRIKVLTG